LKGVKDVSRIPELRNVYRPICSAWIIGTHLPDGLSEASQDLGALMLLRDLRLVQRKTELLPIRARETRQPIERVHEPEELARLGWLSQHDFTIC
jgi:hypothetical protein